MAQTESSPATLFRIIASDTPTESDFLTYADLGKPLLDDSPAGRVRHRGISAFRTETQARRRAQELHLGSHIAEFRLTFEHEYKAGGRGHFTVWGRPRDLLASVVRVVPVD